jgi:ABC-type amino acid transport substrate-binding protein
MRRRTAIFMTVLGLALLSVAVIPGSAAADTLDDARKAGVLRVGNGAMGVKPFLWQNADGTYQGLENDMLKYVLGKIGIPKYEYVVTEWTSLIPGLKAKRWDIIWSGMAVTQERTQGGGITYSRPYMIVYDRIVVRKGSGIRAAGDLKGKVAASTLGSMDSVNAHSLQARGLVGEVKDFNTYGEPFLALRNSQVDVVILDEQQAVEKVKEMPEIEMVGDPLFYVPKPEWADAEAKAPYKLGGLAVGVRREDPKLLEAINAALEAMDKDGTRERILQTHGVWSEHQRNLMKQ